VLVALSVLDGAIEVARRDHPGLDEARVRAEIDRLAERYRALAADADGPAERADAFRRLLFEEGGYGAVSDLASAEHLHIDSVLRRLRGYCLSLSVVALAVAERVDAPLFGVAMPNHFLVRYEEGEFRRDLELTRAGATVALPAARDGSVYGRKLSPRDVKAYLLHNRGYVALRRGERAAARADFEAALRLQPGIGEAHRNLGVVLGEEGKWELAKASFLRAVALHPGDVSALVNLALCRRELGEDGAALRDLDAALAIEPGHARAKELRAAWSNAPPPRKIRPGLRGRYYAGTGFDRLAAERVDRVPDFDWQNGAPAEGVPRDGFSVRWEGWFKAPKEGAYTFFLVANDGARLVVGGRMLVDEWEARGTSNLFAETEARLAAGWHRIRIDHFDRTGGARLMLRVGVEGREKPLDLKTLLFHE